MQLFDDLWRYRYFIISSIRAEKKARFARSKLGGLWFVLHPLVQSFIFATMLSEVLAARLPNATYDAAYAVYVMAGMASWGLFIEILGRCLTMFHDNAGLMKKIAFPRICLVIIILGSSLFNHCMLLLAAAIVFILFGNYPSWSWLAVIPGIVFIAVFAMALGIVIGVLNVFMRDIGQFMTVATQIWFWLTPIVYVKDMPPEQFIWVFDFNPMSAFSAIYQDAFLYHRWPDISFLIGPTAASLALLAAASLLFRRAGPEIVDAL